MTIEAIQTWAAGHRLFLSWDYCPKADLWFDGRDFYLSLPRTKTTAVVRLTPIGNNHDNQVEVRSEDQTWEARYFFTASR